MIFQDQNKNGVSQMTRESKTCDQMGPYKVGPELLCATKDYKMGFETMKFDCSAIFKIIPNIQNIITT